MEDDSVAGYLDFTDGTLTISPGLEIGSYTITLRAVNGVSPEAVKTVTVTVNEVTISLSPAQLPDALFGVAYPATTLKATGGSGSYIFAVTGDLPSGLTLDPDSGEISGTLNGETGDYTFTVTATNNNSNSGEREYVIHAYNAVTIQYSFISWSGAGSPPAIARLSATGGAPGSYTFALSTEDAAGLLEEHGLALQSNGDITGTAVTAAFTVGYDVTVTDAHGNSVTESVTMAFLDH